jgi:holo-[acyl-carrier protein] synthase
MIYGTGVDIVEIQKIQKMLGKEAFLRKVFTDFEIAYCSRYKRSEPHFAGRFAAKEAVFKALGTGFGNGLGFIDVEVKNDKNGKPNLFLYRKAKEFSKTLGIANMLLTISHCENYAVAQVIFEVK